MRALALEMNRLALGHEAMQLGKRRPDSEQPAAERLDEMQIAVLILVGDNDIPYLHAAADYIGEHLPSSGKNFIQDPAHLPNMDQPESFQAALHPCLERSA